jgi:hypothetical protein
MDPSHPRKGKIVNLKTRIVAGAAAGAMVSVLGLTSAPANAATSVTASKTATTATVTGTLEGRAFSGQMSHLSASVVAGTPMLSGTITGPGLPAAGTSFTTPIDSVTAVDPVPDPATVPAPVAPAPAPVVAPAPAPVAPAPAPVVAPAPAPVVAPAPAPIPDVNIPAPECQILAVSVSDLRLNLLGLVILIPELQLLAGGVTGPDALLGNVLCNLAGGAG